MIFHSLGEPRKTDSNFEKAITTHITTTMKPAHFYHICSRLLGRRFLAALAMAALTSHAAWAVPIVQQAYLKASNTGGAPSVGQPGDNFGF